MDKQTSQRSASRPAPGVAAAASSHTLNRKASARTRTASIAGSESSQRRQSSAPSNSIESTLSSDDTVRCESPQNSRNERLAQKISLTDTVVDAPVVIAPPAAPLAVQPLQALSPPPVSGPLSGSESQASPVPARRPEAPSAPVSPTAAVVEIGDDVLVHQAQAGSATAFKLLIERHQRAVYGYFRARVLEASDAEDLCQEVFLRCYQMPATFESPMMVRPWLMGISRNVLREHIRRLSRRKEVAWTELCLEVDSSTPDADDRYDDVVGMLPGCLDALGSSAREALDMYYRSKLRLAQIGERLRRSEGAVKLLMYRARQSLKNCLTRKTGCQIQE